MTFVLMQLAFGAATGGSNSLLFEIVGFVLFAMWLASVVATIVGIIGVVVWGVRQLRSS
ncbi:hypothetical protein [Mycobacterium sp. RTGN5]|uniref:hypothetical protein n=1 Tax=Mycobacterium sp. RTGN5 TaxID=3016522 RepID=UPI0029C794DD|nr:hypothetical protein [Mycobacterium sp. RTGN5]